MNKAERKKRLKKLHARKQFEIEQAAHRRKEYEQRMLRIVKALGPEAEDIYHRMPKIDKEIMYQGRVRAIRVEPEPNVTIPPKLIAHLRKVISDAVKKYKISIVWKGPEVTMEDYFTAGMTIGTYARVSLRDSNLKNLEWVNKEAFEKAFDPIASNKRWGGPYEFLKLIGGECSRRFSRPNSKLYTSRWDIFFDPKNKISNADCLFFQTHDCKKLTVTVDGMKRTCFALGWPSIKGELLWAKVSGTQLGISGPLAELKLDIYIQSHALLRMRERVDIGASIELYENFYQSLDNPKFHSITPGSALLEFRFEKLLLGYFLIEAIEGIALVRTFLFITNSGTPQGAELSRILGTEKLDKQHLGIDKISTFFKTDILRSERFRAALTDAGCKHLIDIGTYIINKGAHEKGYAQYIDRYLSNPQSGTLRENN